MGRKSSIDDLPDPILAQLKEKLGKGKWSYDQVVEWLRAGGYGISRSAVGRYGKRFAAVAARLKESSVVADGLISELGEAATQGKTGEMLVQIMRTLSFERAMAIGDGTDLDTKDLHFLCRAVKDLAAAQKIGTDRELAIRKETVRKAADKAEAIVGEEVRKIGQQLPPEALKRIREEIYGIVDRQAA